jgi:hypothetical protein
VEPGPSFALTYLTNNKETDALLALARLYKSICLLYKTTAKNWFLSARKNI